MKSSFLLALLMTSMISNGAFAQATKKTKPTKKPVAAKPVAVKPVAAKVESKAPSASSNFQKFYDRLKIGYYGVFTSPHLRDMKNGRWKNASISPEWSRTSKNEHRNQDTWPTNIWHQVTFTYNFGAKMSFVVAPRFMTPLASSEDMKKPEDNSFIMLDDMLVGFAGVIYSSDDKKFNLWVRPGVRLPTSRLNRNSGNGGAGTVTHQLDLSYSPTYDFNNTWQIGIFGQFRQWVIEDQYGFDRFRIITNPFVQYTIDDVSRVQVYYEYITETDRRGKPADERDPVWKDSWQNVTVGYNRDINSKLNLFPFVGVFVNDVPLTDKSVWLGAWISYKIK
jgi:hypothetical protein